jgi:hypothetical protein
MRRWHAAVIGLLVCGLVACGNDGDGAGFTPNAATDLGSPSGTDDDHVDEAAEGDGIQPGEQTEGSGTVTIGESSWEIEGTCNSPTKGIVLLTGTAVGDASTEIYVTATPGAPDSASAYVTKGDEFDWQTGSSYQTFGVSTPKTSFSDGTGEGTGTFVDLSQPTLDPVLADGGWEFSC